MRIIPPIEEKPILAGLARFKNTCLILSIFQTAREPMKISSQITASTMAISTDCPSTRTSSRVEPVDEIRARMLEVLNHLPAARVLAAPDCGLGFLGRDLAMKKLKNLCEAAQSVG